MALLITFLLLFHHLFQPIHASPHGQQTPIMGWSGYNRFMQNSGHCDKAGAAGYNQTTVIQTMDALVSTGLAKLGYIYINLDDCWLAQNRTANGDITADKTRFPNGMKWLATQAHLRNLKLGLYEAASDLTCRQYPGSQGNEERDAKTIAGFGADFVKLDSCSPTSLGGTGPEAWQNQYLRWSKALNKANPNIIFSCSWPVYYDTCIMQSGNSIQSCGIAPYQMNTSSTITNICHMWRYDLDLKPTWTMNGNGVGDIIKKMMVTNTPCDEAGGYNWTETYREITHRGAFNDPDFLIVGCPTNEPCEPNSMQGHTALSDIEQRTQMSVWCIMNAPLIIGSDIRALSSTAMSTLSNVDAIFINQNEFVRKPFEIDVTQPKDEDGNVIGWARRLNELGDVLAIAVIDLRNDVSVNASLNVNVMLSSLLLNMKNGTELIVKDVWKKQITELVVGDVYGMELNGEHSSKLLLVRKKEVTTTTKALNITFHAPTLVHQSFNLQHAWFSSLASTSSLPTNNLLLSFSLGGDGTSCPPPGKPPSFQNCSMTQSSTDGGKTWKPLMDWSRHSFNTLVPLDNNTVVSIRYVFLLCCISFKYSFKFKSNQTKSY